MLLVYLDNIEPDRLLNLGAEAAVSTACPRVALDDARQVIKYPYSRRRSSRCCWG